MPQLAMAAVTTFSGWMASSATATVMGNLLISTAVSSLSSFVMKQNMRGNQPGLRTEHTTDGGDKPMSFVLGWYATDGHMVCPPMSHGKFDDWDNAYLTYVVSLGNVPGAKLESVIIDDEEVRFSGTDATFTQGGAIPAGKPDWWYRQQGMDPANPSAARPNVTPGRPADSDEFRDKIWLRYYDGSQTTADPYLLKVYGTGTKWDTTSKRPWTEDMVGTGTCYAILTFRFSRKSFTGLPRCRFIIAGTPLYDPRKDSSAGGDGVQRWSNPSTWQTSTNAIVLAYNILRGIPIAGGPLWGYGVDLSALPFATWAPAMNAAAEMLDGALRWQAGYEVSVEDEPSDVLDEILKAACAKVAEVGGVWRVRVGPPASPVLFLTDDDLVVDEDATNTPFPGLAQTFNAVHASYPEPKALWKVKDAPPRYNPDLEAADQNRRLVAELNLPACPWKSQVQRVMKAYIREERRFRRHVVTLPPDAEALEPLDVIALTSMENGYASKLFEVAEVSEHPDTLNVTVSMLEVDPSDYDFQAGDLLPSPIAPNVVPRPVAVTPQFFTAEGIALVRDGRPRGVAARLRWGGWALSDVSSVRWETRLSGQTDAARGVMASPEEGETIVSPGLTPTTAYEARISFITASGRDAAWTAWKSFITPAAPVAWDDLAKDLQDNLDAGQARIDAAEKDAQAAAKQAKDATAAADAAQKYATEQVQKAREDFAVDIQTSVEAAGQSKVARDASEAAAKSALEGAGKSADSAKSADGSAKAAAGSAKTASEESTKAGKSATAAAADATTAVTARGDAETFTKQASSSATEADKSKVAAQTASGVAVEAKGKAEKASGDASGSAKAASESETLAGASAKDAKREAGVATKQRQDAETAAGAAFTSEKSAATAKQDAEKASAAAQRSADISATIASRGSSVLEDQFLSHPGWGRRASTGGSIVPNMVYPTGNTWQFDLTADQGNVFQAMNATSSGLWTGQINARGYVVEIEMNRTGSLSGAGVLLTWTDSNGAEASAEMSLTNMMTGTNTSGSRQMAVGVFPRPPAFGNSGAFSHSLQFLFNDTRFGAWAAKRIFVHRVNIRVATAEELGKGQVEAQISATLSESYLTKVDTNQAIANAETRLNATYGPVRTKVDRVDTALSDLSGGIASIKYVAQAGSANAAGIEAVSIDRNGNKTTSVLRLRGDQVIADGTMSVGALTVGGGVNMLEDATFQDGLTNYFTSTPGSATSAYVRRPPLSYAHPAYPTLFIEQTNTNSNEASAYIAARPRRDTGWQFGYPCKPGAFYCASVFSYSMRCTSNLQIAFIRADGTWAGSRVVANSPNTGSSTTPDSWSRDFVIMQAPADAVYIQVRYIKLATSSGDSNSFLALWKPQLEETHAAASQPMPWSSGAVAMIGPDRIFARSMAARHMDTETAVITVSAQINLGIIREAHIIDGNVTNAKIGDYIQSDNFVAGDSGRGWRIRKSGDAEFNTVKIRRQIEVASGTRTVGNFIPFSQNLRRRNVGGSGDPSYEMYTPSGSEVSRLNGPGATIFIDTTPIAITEWMGAQRTYLATVGMTGGTVSRPSGMNSNSVMWGWTATVLPLTLWDTLNGGSQCLRLRLEFWSENVTEVKDCVLRWKIYEVS